MSNDPGIDVLEVLESMDIVSEFPEKSWKRPSEFGCTDESDLEGHLDLREDYLHHRWSGCQDLDDAVHIKRLKNGNFELGVHIADVSYYVKRRI